jgi:hypothetical protein
MFKVLTPDRQVTEGAAVVLLRRRRRREKGKGRMR